MDPAERERRLIGRYHRPGGTWDASLELGHDHRAESCSSNVGFAGGQSHTYRGTWTLAGDGALELHFTEHEYDLDYGSASSNSVSRCDSRERWTVAWGEDGEPVRLGEGSDALVRKR